MKIGDLVVLSAYGKKIQTIRRLRNDIGIIISDEPYDGSIHVKWTRCGFVWVNRRDIKTAGKTRPYAKSR